MFSVVYCFHHTHRVPSWSNASFHFYDRVYHCDYAKGTYWLSTCYLMGMALILCSENTCFSYCKHVVWRAMYTYSYGTCS